MRRAIAERVAAAVIVAFGALAPAAAAWAGQGKAGLWEVTMRMKMAGMPDMPDMTEMPPEVREQMKAMNVESMGGHTITTRQCITPAQAASDQPPAMPENQDCKMTDSKRSGKSFSGTMVCTGEFKGTGTFRVTYESDEHYSGEMTMTGSAEDQPMDMHQTFEGKWLGADCGAVRPGTAG